MKIAVACGGTGGHIFPGLATAQELVGRGHDVTLWLAGRDVESASIQDWEGAVVHLPSQGLRGGWRTRLGAVGSMFGVVRAAVRKMHLESPDVVLAMGSYASVGPGMAAWWLRIPLVLHEGNAVPGRAVQFLVPFAKVIGTGFPDVKVRFGRAKAVYCGFPVRAAFVGLARMPQDPPCLLITGGSQGAAILNRVMPEAIRLYLARGGRLIQVVHLSGAREYEVVVARYEGIGCPVVVNAFSGEMPRLYAGASLAVTRAGAATCTELAIARVPAVLVPLACAPGNHQWHNAQCMARTGGFRVVAEQAFAPAAMADMLYEIFMQPERLAALGSGLPGGVVPDGTQRLADLVELQARMGCLPR